MKNIIYGFKIFWNLVRLARNPNRTECVFRIADSLYKMGRFQLKHQRPLRDPDSTEILKSKYRLKAYQIDELNRCGEGTLGKAYAQHMISNGLQPDFFSEIPVENDVTYVMMRMRETHDLWHTLTGFGTSVSHELGLQAFSFAQAQVPISALLIGGAIVSNVFKDPLKLLEIFDQVVRGWKMGKEAKVIFGLNWESHWNTPLQDLRTQYQIHL